MTKLKLLQELNNDSPTLIEAESNGVKHYTITGVFLQAELKNRNGRVYPKHVMENAVDKYVNEQINRGTAWGELDHPPTPSISAQNVSHLIESLTWDGNNVIGKAKIINEGKGRIARGMIEVGGRIGVSSRGLGALKEDAGVLRVQEGFFFATAADIVTNPSAPDAFVTAVFENYDWIYDAASKSYVQEKVEDLTKQLKGLNARELQEQKLAKWEEYCKLLGTSFKII